MRIVIQNDNALRRTDWSAEHCMFYLKRAFILQKVAAR
jgi:hypothetical protein